MKPTTPAIDLPAIPTTKPRSSLPIAPQVVSRVHTDPAALIASHAPNRPNSPQAGIFDDLRRYQTKCELLGCVRMRSNEVT